MFREWGFLLGEIWFLLLLAALLGLLAGWIIWGRMSRYKSEADNLRAQLNTCENNLNTCRGDLDACRSTQISKPISASVSAADIDYDGDGIIEGTNEGTRPEALDGPRGGIADDLKQIKGVGNKMENLCNSLGFYHFDQIAGWSGDEVAWVDANLEGFKGRVTRDDWVAQAKILAAGGTTEFSKKVEKGAVDY